MIDGYNMVAKIYKDQKTANERKEKIEAMAKACIDLRLDEIGLTEQIAWPMLALYDAAQNFTGFCMVHMDGQFDLDAMYLYPPTKNAHITLADKVDVLIDLCELIEVVHYMDQVFGDFNPDNIKIKANKSVCFLDADSFHVQLDGKLHKCVVCAPGYVAPEVVRAAKGSTYAACKGPTFTKYSDYFALAIHVYRMLHNGVHPFVAQYDIDALGSLPSPEPIDLRVEAGKSPRYNPSPYESVPVMTPVETAFPSYLTKLFESAFHTNLNNPKSRPTATDFKNALRRYRSELKECYKDSTHYYWKGNAKCPYCEADAKTKDAVVNVATQTMPVRNISLAPPKKTNSYTAGKGSNGNTSYLGNGQYYAAKNRMMKKLNGVTTVLAFILQIILCTTLYQNLYSALLDHGWGVALASFGSFLFGMWGLYLHNHHISENRLPRPSDYITALLASFAMSLVFIPVAAIFSVIFGLLAGIVKGIIIFLIVCAVIGALINA